MGIARLRSSATKLPPLPRAPPRAANGITAAYFAALVTLGCGTSTPAEESGAPDATADSTSSPPVSASEAGAETGSVVVAPDGGGCGYQDSGTVVHVAAGLDICLPKTACNAETCPPQLGTCTEQGCAFKPGYLGIETLPEAWVTHYCDLSAAGCHGVTQVEFPEVTAQKIATAKGLTLCDQVEDGGTGECVGIAASPPMIVGNSQRAVDALTDAAVTDWGLGLTEASSLCYELTGPGGTVLVALTDRCGGYCQCSGSAFEECGPCVNAPDMAVNCSCVGTVPPVYSACCGAGAGCSTLNAQCDWCASNNHPHFDLDDGSFNHICGSLANEGSCQLTSARFVPCLTGADAPAWPPTP